MREKHVEKCSICGRSIMRNNSSKGKMVFKCKDCIKIEKRKKDAQEKLNDRRDKYEKRFDDAVIELFLVVDDPTSYDAAIEKTKEQKYLFDSIPEVMVAIELNKLKIPFVSQRTIKGYRVDFLLPDEKIVLEIDGTIYHTKQTSKDGILQFALGFDWHIIHIPSELIRKDLSKLKLILDKKESLSYVG